MNKLFFYLAIAGTTIFAQDVFAQQVNSTDSNKKELLLDKKADKMGNFDPIKNAENVAKQLQKRYELNADQTVKVQTASAKFATDVKALKDKNKEASTDALRTAYNTSLKGILTAEQYSQLTKDLEEAAKHTKSPRHEHDGKRPEHANHKGKPEHANHKGKPEHANHKGKPEHAKGKDKSDDAKGKGKGKSDKDKAQSSSNEAKKEVQQRPFDIYKMLGDHAVHNKAEDKKAEDKSVQPAVMPKSEKIK